ncbi:MAG: hypothetical protein KGM24_06770 [Elusimicrobia bacterium]|nr:hypothetical protein [Elusimicrobiota bacterium]
MSRSRLLLAATLVLAAAASASAQESGEGLSRFLGVGGDRGSYGASVMPAGSGAPSVFEQEASGSAVAVRRGSDTWSVSGGAGETSLSRSLAIPGSPLAVPRDLWDVRAGAGFSRGLGDRRGWGASLALGSASDELFHSMRETSLSATARWQLPSGARDSWILLLNYSNNRTFLNGAPLPGAAYVARSADDRLFAVVGFPFVILRVRPDPRTTLSFRLFGGSSYALEAARRLGRVSAYARLERAPRQWLVADRSDAKDRLIFDQKAALLGARGRLPLGLAADAALGRTFDRRFYVARDAGRAVGDRAALANGWLIRASLTKRWGAGGEDGR